MYLVDTSKGQSVDDVPTLTRAKKLAVEFYNNSDRYIMCSVFHKTGRTLELMFKIKHKSWYV